MMLSERLRQVYAAIGNTAYDGMTTFPPGSHAHDLFERIVAQSRVLMDITEDVEKLETIRDIHRE